MEDLFMKQKILLMAGIAVALSIGMASPAYCAENNHSVLLEKAESEKTASKDFIIRNNSKMISGSQCEHISEELKNYIEAKYGKDKAGNPEFAFANYEVDFDDAIHDNQKFIDVVVTVDMLYHGEKSVNPDDDMTHVLFSIKLNDNLPNLYTDGNVEDSSTVKYDLFYMRVADDTILVPINRNEIDDANAKMSDTSNLFEVKANDENKESGLLDKAIDVLSGSYDKAKAVDYALKHCTDEPQYSQKNGKGSDCANFVSKCINAGGIKTDSKWYPGTGESWGSDNWIRTGYYKICTILTFIILI